MFRSLKSSVTKCCDGDLACRCMLR